MGSGEMLGATFFKVREQRTWIFRPSRTFNWLNRRSCKSGASSSTCSTLRSSIIRRRLLRLRLRAARRLYQISRQGRRAGPSLRRDRPLPSSGSRERFSWRRSSLSNRERENPQPFNRVITERLKTREIYEREKRTEGARIDANACGDRGTLTACSRDSALPGSCWQNPRRVQRMVA